MPARYADGRTVTLTHESTVEDHSLGLSADMHDVRGLWPALSVAILLPCYNEEAAIAKTILDFKTALPDAVIYVYDNNSTDRTSEAAAAAGAIVRQERKQGKGFVVRRMFADIDADVYVLADGDATYDAAAAPTMIGTLAAAHLDMVVGCRRAVKKEAYRPGHRTGNWLLTSLLKLLFGTTFTDVLSGYRVFSRRFVKSFPVISQGFEIETEISVHALELDLPVAEVLTTYLDRPSGSFSKLSTYKDGFRILNTILRLVRLERPVLFFGMFASALLLLSLGLGFPIVLEFYRTGLVPRFPTAILATGLSILSALSFFCGLILDTVVRGRQEVRRLAYLSLPRLGVPR